MDDFVLLLVCLPSALCFARFVFSMHTQCLIFVKPFDSVLD